MKILLSAYSCEPNRGSEMEMGWQAVEELASTAAEVVVVTKTSSKDAINRYLTANASVAERFSNIQFIFYELPAWIQKRRGAFLGAQFNGYLWEVGLFFYLQKLYKKNEFDIAHKVTLGSYRFPSLIWYFANRFIWGPFCSGERLPLKFLSIYSWKGRIPELARLTIQRLALFDPLVLLGFYKADYILTMTSDTHARLPAFARRKATMITYKYLIAHMSSFDPVEPAVLTEMKKNNTLQLLYIGRLLEWKGVMLVLQALKELQGKLTYEFTIMGDGPAKNYYEEYIRQHNLNVVFVSPKGIPRRKLSAYYLSHDLFIFPGLHGTASYVMVEAQLHQMPVLMLDITASPCFKQERRDIIISTDEKTVPAVVTEIARRLLIMADLSPVKLTSEEGLITPVISLGQDQTSRGSSSGLAATL